jgi:hypothetical protein
LAVDLQFYHNLPGWIYGRADEFPVNITMYKQLYDDLDNLSIDDLCKKYSIKNKYILDKIFIEQNSCCGECYITEWNNKPIKFHLHHIDGNNKNNLRYNLIFLCPNCHSQTDNYCFCNRNHSEKTKEKLRDYFSSKI